MRFIIPRNSHRLWPTSCPIRTQVSPPRNISDRTINSPVVAMTRILSYGFIPNSVGSEAQTSSYESRARAPLTQLTIASRSWGGGVDVVVRRDEDSPGWSAKWPNGSETTGLDNVRPNITLLDWICFASKPGVIDGNVSKWRRRVNNNHDTEITDSMASFRAADRAGSWLGREKRIVLVRAGSHFGTASSFRTDFASWNVR